MLNHNNTATIPDRDWRVHEVLRDAFTGRETGFRPRARVYFCTFLCEVSLIREKKTCASYLAKEILRSSTSFAKICSRLRKIPASRRLKVSQSSRAAYISIQITSRTYIGRGKVAVNLRTSSV